MSYLEPFLQQPVMGPVTQYEDNLDDEPSEDADRIGPHINGEEEEEEEDDKVQDDFEGEQQDEEEYSEESTEETEEGCEAIDESVVFNKVWGDADAEEEAQADTGKHHRTGMDQQQFCSSTQGGKGYHLDFGDDGATPDHSATNHLLHANSSTKQHQSGQAQSLLDGTIPCQRRSLDTIHPHEFRRWIEDANNIGYFQDPFGYTFCCRLCVFGNRRETREHARFCPRSINFALTRKEIKQRIREAKQSRPGYALVAEPGQQMLNVWKVCRQSLL